MHWVKLRAEVWGSFFLIQELLAFCYVPSTASHFLQSHGSGSAQMSPMAGAKAPLFLFR